MGNDAGAERHEVRVAVIGFGARSEIAAHIGRARDGAVVVAIVEPSVHGRERAAAKHPEARLHETTEALIAAGGIDAAIVTAPDDTHEAIAVALLRAGIPVYLEKPLAISLEGADAVLEAAAVSDTKLYVGHNFRHAAVVRTMRASIEAGEIGEVKAIWVRHFVGNGVDYYFKDWHADRSRTGTLLLQKASHDIDIIHYLANGVTRRVVGMGGLTLLGSISDRRERVGETMPDWFSLDNWPPLAQTGLNPVVDVEDLSMMLMQLDNGVFASYQQCHYTPDYWRNYTVIGTEGRLENYGDTGGSVVKVWNRRHDGLAEADIEHVVDGDDSGHEDADLLTMREFFAHILDDAPTIVSPLAAREAVAAGALAAASLRSGSQPIDVPPPSTVVVDHLRQASTPALPERNPA